MRKESKTIRNQLNENANQLQGYHQVDDYRVNYAVQGYEGGFKFFNSDRIIPLDSQCQNQVNNQVVAGFGLEIEQGNENGLSSNSLVILNKQIIFADFHKSLFKYMHDGSIDGIECITQIMSKSFIRNHYRDFYNSRKLMSAFGITPDTSCGMHINMSNNLFGADRDIQADNIKKMIYLINKNYSFFCNLYNRTRISYCSIMSAFVNKEYAKNFDLVGFGTEHNSNHGICFNYAHFGVGRVELRLVGPANNFQQFVRSCEMTFALIEFVKKTSWDKLDNIEKLINDYKSKIDTINTELGLTGLSKINYSKDGTL